MQGAVSFTFRIIYNWLHKMGVLAQMKQNISKRIITYFIGLFLMTTGIDFSKVKVVFDVSMVAISFVVCLIMIGNMGSVGIGTMIAAILVGTVHGVFTKVLGEKRDVFLGNNV